jgi:hypothetical protein
MVTDKVRQLKQDLNEVSGVLENLEPYTSYLDGKLKELNDKFSLLQEHLKDHIEDVENFVGRIN